MSYTVHVVLGHAESRTGKVDLLLLSRLAFIWAQPCVKCSHCCKKEWSVLCVTIADLNSCLSNHLTAGQAPVMKPVCQSFRQGSNGCYRFVVGGLTCCFGVQVCGMLAKQRREASTRPLQVSTYCHCHCGEEGWTRQARMGVRMGGQLQSPG